MHDYAIFGHDRSTIGRYLGSISIILAGGISQFLAFANKLTGLEAFSKASITTGIVYFVLDWAFNKWAWKIPLFKIPDINGKWETIGQTLNEDGGVKFNWNGEIGIEQNWKKILIHLKTENSQSKSYTATLLNKHGSCTCGWLLTYSYRNEPELEQSHELKLHKGYCEIELDKDLMSGKASYFNSVGRRTFGTMNLKRVQS